MGKQRYFSTETTVVVYKKGKLQTGFVLAGFYAKKVRKVIFAQLEYVLSIGEITTEAVVRDVGELNKTLYEQLFEKLKVSKGDVVKIEIDYAIENKQIKWLWDTLKIKVWRVTEET